METSTPLLYKTITQLFASAAGGQNAVTSLIDGAEIICHERNGVDTCVRGDVISNVVWCRVILRSVS